MTLSHRYTFPLIGSGGIALVLGGLQGPWIKLPLSSSLFATDFSSPVFNLIPSSLQDLLLLMMLIIAIGWLFKLRVFSALASVVALGLFVYFFIFIWGVDHHWFAVYITESEQRTFLQNTLNRYYWPNLNPEPATILLSKFEYLHEQLALFWHMAGWGWVLTFSGMALLYFNALFDRVTVWPVILATAVLIIFIITAMYPFFKAELSQRHGDAMLSSGYPEKAITAYDKALRLYPALGYSRPFAMKSSHAYYLLDGDYSALAYLYLAGANAQSITKKSGKKSDSNGFNRARLLFLDGSNKEYSSTPLQRVIMNQSVDENIRILISQGHNAYEKRDLSASLVAFQQALKSDPSQIHAQFFTAHIFKELGLFDNAISTLNSILLTITNKPLRADLICTIGETYQDSGYLLQAREAYRQCFDNDSLFNYRAVRNLGGT